MNADLAAAHKLLRDTIAAALQAGRERAVADNAFVLEESSEWEQVGALLVPSLSSADLAHAAEVVGEPRLPGVLAQSDQRRAALRASRDALVRSMLLPADARAVDARRTLIEDRLAQARARCNGLRARPGVVEGIESARRGLRVKDAVAAVVEEITALEQATRALETEATSLGAIAVRHHRTRRDLASIDDEVSALEAEALRDARGLVVDALARKRGTPSALQPLAAHLHRLEGIEAKREILASLYERWVRIHGARLVELQRNGASITGFEILSWSARVQLHVAEAAQAVDAFRRICAALVSFTRYEDVTGSWWSALAPGVAGDPRGSQQSEKIVDLAASAEDKLAVAWASMKDGARAPAPAGARVLTEGGRTEQGANGALSLQPPLPSITGTHALTSLSARGGTAVSDSSAEEPASDTPPPSSFDDFSDIFAAAAMAPTAIDHAVEPMEQASAPSLGSARFAQGNRIGRFEIEALIGKGGMGEVYRARLAGDAGFRRLVVLKRLAIDLQSDPEALRMFAAEAAIAARIAHPNVVQIFDVQTHGGQPFMVMEHLDGLSLLKVAQRATAAGLTFERAVLTRCAIDAARGLHAAHTMRGDDGNLAGLVHRDVSPDNLFLCSNGYTKLLDFGVARRNDLTTRTRANELKGKVPYMSPEQILGERLDGRSDLFSLGSTLYQLLSGRRPFQGENDVSTLYAVVHKPHVPVHATLDDAGELGDVIERLLQKRPADRPSSALEVVDALEQADPATPEAAGAFLARVWTS